MERFPALPSILNDSATIRFLPDSDDPDLGQLDLSKNPVKTPSGAFAWFLPDRVTEAISIMIGKTCRSAIGDKSGPYFSLPEARWVCVFCLPITLSHSTDPLIQLPDITAEEMAKAKVGFAIRFINKRLVVDALLPDELKEHNQAALEFFLTVQQKADERLGPCEYNIHVCFPSAVR